MNVTNIIYVSIFLLSVFWGYLLLYGLNATLKKKYNRVQILRKFKFEIYIHYLYTSCTHIHVTLSSVYSLKLYLKN